MSELNEKQKGYFGNLYIAVEVEASAEQPRGFIIEAEFPQPLTALKFKRGCHDDALPPGIPNQSDL